MSERISERIEYMKNLFLWGTDAEIVMVNPYIQSVSDTPDKIKEAIEYLKNDESVDIYMEFSEDNEYCTVTLKAK